MSKQLPILPLILASTVLLAHPMGNFTVSHYTHFQVNSAAVDALYVLDLAEIPTGELLSEWGLDRNSAPDLLKKKAVEQAREWQSHLEITADGRQVKPAFLDAELALTDGAANLPVVRITSHFRLNQGAGKRLIYEDRNFPSRAGWKEIVIDAGKGATLIKASQGSSDRSKALTEYPQDPTIAPPQDVRAAFEWSAQPTPVLAVPKATPPAMIVPVEQPKGQPSPAPAASTPAGAPPGAVVKGDYLSRLLRQRDLSLGVILIALAAAFGLGAAHALTPGHGKTIVAAYLVGSRGSLKHAAYLGAMVTFTHTVSVFLLGLATLFLFQYIMPEKITQALGVISGLSIVALGGWMLYKRARGSGHSHEGHSHKHPHKHQHSHGKLVHSHGPGGHVHSHDVPEEISWASLTALAVSGGLVPCETALVLLLSAIALGRIGLGLLLLVAFSLGLAVVLMAIGAIIIYAKHLLPERNPSKPNFLIRWMPVASAAVVTVVGLIMTGVSLGWLQAGWMI